MTAIPAAFDPGGPLPAGLTALEASAGTGKTYALTALAVRYVAEAGVPAGGLCIVSFTEAATAELRGRVRSRLVEAVAHIEAGAPPVDDPVLGAIASAQDPAPLLATRLARLRQAVAEFDAATVATIHGFASRVLSGASSAAAGAGLTESAFDVDEAVNDLFLARAGDDPDTKVRVDRVAEAVRARLSMPESVMAHLAPCPAGKADPAGPLREQWDLAVALADDARDEVLHRRAKTRRRTFDGLLCDARDLLTGPGGPTVVAALRSRYQVVLIDEFQDTDRVQWDIFRTAFVDGPAPVTVVLVGDPKQSIYRFRSADISAYLDATAAAREVSTLTTNWRSDAPLLRSLEQVFDGATFGDAAIAFSPVDAAPGHEHRGLHGACPESLVIRCVPRGADAALSAPRARRLVRADVVAEVAELLGGDVQVDDPSAEGGKRPLAARDIAVLTRSNADAVATALDLGAHGFAAATAATRSVLETDAAIQWTVLLRALERPGHPGFARAAALGWFVGITAERLAVPDDDSLAELHDELREWALLLAGRGIPALLAAARARGLNTRLLQRRLGERHLTDLDHIAELMQSATGGRPVGAAALLAMLAELGAGGDEEMAREQLARRIDRDDDAVQVLTIHRAKGLEFPVVLCPYLWTTRYAGGQIPHAQIDGRRQLDSGWVIEAPTTGWAKGVRAQASVERDGEDRRLLYVALTRARHRCVVWWVPTTAKGKCTLGSLFEERLGATPVGPGDFAPLVDAAGGALAAVTALARPVRSPSGPVQEPPPLEVATARRRVDQTWRIWSFSSVKAGADLRRVDAAASSSPPDATDRPVVGGVDEAAPGPTEALAVSGAAGAVTSRLSDAPGGTRFGTLVHRVFERCDFASATLEADLVALCEEELRYQRLSVEPAALAAALTDVVDAPLGGPLGERCLRDLHRHDRLDELVFDLPLAAIRADRIGAALADHLAPDDPLLAWASSMRDETGFDIDIAGMLTGSIDLVARTAPDGLYFVADYKTNQLGPASGYTTGELAAAMAHSHYPLQAALYLVALHRFLRWRLPGYDPQRHLGGAAYLFVRGMVPASASAAPRGVLWWRPPVAAVHALDRLLATGGSS